MPEFDTAVGVLHHILLKYQVKVLMRRDSITIADQGSKNAGLENTDNEYAKKMMQKNENKKLINDCFNKLSQEEQLLLQEFVNKLGLPEDYLPIDTGSIIDKKEIPDDQEEVKPACLQSTVTPRSDITGECNKRNTVLDINKEQPKTSFSSIFTSLLCCCNIAR